MLEDKDIREARYYKREGDYLTLYPGDKSKPEGGSVEAPRESTHYIEGRLVGVRYFTDLPATPYGVFLASSHICGNTGSAPALVGVLLSTEEARIVIPALVGTISYRDFTTAARYRFYVAEAFKPLEVDFYRHFGGCLHREPLQSTPVISKRLLERAIILLNSAIAQREVNTTT